MRSPLVVAVIPDLSAHDAMAQVPHELQTSVAQAEITTPSPLSREAWTGSVLTGRADNRPAAHIARIASQYGLAVAPSPPPTPESSPFSLAVLEGTPDWPSFLRLEVSANVLIVGTMDGSDPGALIALGPDVMPGIKTSGEPHDVYPTLLALLELLPPPGLQGHGRTLHEIFRWAYSTPLDDEPQIPEARQMPLATECASSATSREAQNLQ